MSETINNYLKLYPDEFSDVMAAVNCLGLDEVNTILKTALNNKQRVEFTDVDNELDNMVYKYV